MFHVGCVKLMQQLLGTFGSITAKRLSVPPSPRRAGGEGVVLNGGAQHHRFLHTLFCIFFRIR